MGAQTAAAAAAAACLLAGCGGSTKTTSEADVQVADGQQKIVLYCAAIANGPAPGKFTDALAGVEELIAAARAEPTAAHKQALIAERVRLEGPECANEQFAQDLRQALAEPPLAP